jgi:hypothetical protein
LILSVPFLCVALLPTALGADDEKMGESAWYPLKPNSVWHYKLGDGAKFKLKAVKEEKFENKTPSMRVEMLDPGANDKMMSWENIQITKDGVFRLAFEGNKADPPVKFMALPPKKDESWPVESKIGKETLKGKFKMGEEAKLKIGDKEYTDLYYTECDDLDANGMKVKFKTYFAKDVGMVKQIITVGAQPDIVIELEKYEEGK